MPLPFPLCLVALVAALVLAPAASAQAGAPDLTFGDGGVVRLAPGELRGLQDVLPLDDGRIVASGALDGDVAVYRFGDDGSPDATFGSGGIARIDAVASGVGAAVARRGDGRLVVAVRFVAGGGALVGLTEGGSLDPTFGTDGLVLGSDAWTDVAVDDAGRLVAFGRDETTPEMSPAVAARFLGDGTPDAAFGTGGRVEFLAGEDVGAGRLALHPDGRISISGLIFGAIFEAAPFAARLTSDGALDPTFGDGGIASPELASPFAGFFGTALDAEGRLLAAGLTIDFTTGASGAFVARLDAGGALDATFGDGGVATLATGEPLAQAADVLVQPDGKIIAVGVAGEQTEAGFFAARLLDGGALDPTFGTAGVAVLFPPPGDTELAIAVALTLTDEVVLAGYRSGPDGEADRAVVARLLNDTDLDAAPPAADGAVALALAGPNPSAAPRVRLALAQAAAVRVTVHDARGRTLAVLHDGALAAGATELGLGTLAAGVYVVRARFDAGAATLPVAVVR